MKTKVMVDFREKSLFELSAEGDEGTAFPYGNNVKYECDAHRSDYSHADAQNVAEFVNQSSWISRKGR